MILQFVLQIDSCFSRISTFIDKMSDAIIPQKRNAFIEKGMRYYIRRYNSSHWKRISTPKAVLVFLKPRRWERFFIIWHPDMLSVPNRIDCADAEMIVISSDGAGPIEGMKNLRRRRYYEELKKEITEWYRDIERILYKTEHLGYIWVPCKPGVTGSRM